MPTTIKCENALCKEAGKLHCSKCKALGLSKTFGNYCSAKCQEICYPTHKVFHNKRYQLSYSWTILIALKELELIGELPGLDSENSFAIYMYGCRDGTEIQGRRNDLHEFTNLFENLKRTLFPSIVKLNVQLSGLQVTNAPEIKEENVIITYINSSCQDLLSTPPDVNHSVAILSHPGFSAANYFTQWEPAVHRLIALNMTTICTAYSHKDHFTYDAVMDERILYSYFLANTIVCTTFNPAYLSDPTGHVQVLKNRVYSAFKGPRTASTIPPPEIVNGLPVATPTTTPPTSTTTDETIPIVALTKQQLLSVNQIEFIKSLAFIATQYESNPSLSERCKKVLKSLSEGKRPFDPSVSLQELDQLLMSGRI